MATDKPRFTITLSDALYDDVTRYKDSRNISTQSKAIQNLVAAAIKALAEEAEADKGPEPQTSDEKAIVQGYRGLDRHGKNLVRLVIDAEVDRIKEQAAVETPVIDLGTIRHYFYSPAAGPDGLAEDEFEDIPRTEDMPRCADFCVTLSGDSMEPYLHDGQMIFVARDRQVNRLDVGVWYYQGGTYVKQLDKREDAIYLLSANPDREAANLRIPYESEHDLRCYGKVLGIKKLPLPEYR
jgi:phage repressor protein C with HTH and peptisase S24 domain